MSLTSTSSSDFPKVVMVDLSRQTITRCEVAVCSALMARTMAFCRLVYHCFCRWSWEGQGDQAHASQQPQQQPNQPAEPAGAASAEQPAAADALDELVPLDQGDTDPAVLNDFHLPHDFMSSRPSAVVAGLSFQNDVTNSSNWRNKKLSSLEALISILRNVDALADGHFDKAFAKMRGLRQSQCNEQRVACRVDLSLG